MGEMGPTLPFIVGALAVGAERPATVSNLDALLDEMISHPIHDFVTEASWCPNIQAPVITLGAMYGYRMRSPLVIERVDRSGDSFVFGQNLISHWQMKDSTAALRQLRDDAVPPIETQQFSRNWHTASRSYVYGPFLDGELDYIKLVLRKE